MATSSKKLPNLRLQFAIPLSVTLVVYAILAFTGVAELDSNPNRGVLKSFRDPDASILIQIQSQRTNQLLDRRPFLKYKDTNITTLALSRPARCAGNLLVRSNTAATYRQYSS